MMNTEHFDRNCILLSTWSEGETVVHLRNLVPEMRGTQTIAFIDKSTGPINNPHDWLKDAISLNKESFPVFAYYLSKYKSEEAIRFFLAVAATWGTKKLVVVEKRTNNRIINVIRKSSLALDLMLLEQEAGESIVFRCDNNTPLRHSPYRSSEEEYLQSWCGVRNGKIANSDMLLSCANEALRERVGFSFIRVNHCEPRMIGYPLMYFNSDVYITTRIQWGAEDLSSDDLRYISYELQNSVRMANYIGVPQIKKRIEQKLHILENSVYTLGKNLDLFNEQCCFTNVNVHLELGSSESFFSMMRNAERIVLISGRDVQSALSVRLGQCTIESIPLPAEKEFADRGYACGVHFPTVYRNVVSEIRSRDLRGCLVLVGGGILGKIYCREVKERGGVALDIGSLFDAWAGLNTRGAGFSDRLRLSPTTPSF
ncbi:MULTISPECIES: hypothetical protein [unclassified Azospirillum]|uniref:GT-D fold domain-containing protein n=1 Tax=unclassified Azospirillum TaxID=2630922 RepID=UPI0011B21599|nr:MULTISPECIES: hypothetical protein [unclassified Azospirillum]